jgi:O-methyltransferase involved in polyketide biosynthesis
LAKRPPELGEVQETLLIPLYGRAVETRKRRPLLSDPRAVEIVESLDYDFRKFDRTRSLFGSVLRTVMFDEWVRAFIDRHPSGTVIEIGAGLNTRFERLDNRRIHWIDIDLPDAAALRTRYFGDTARRITIGASVLDSSWIDVAKRRPGPYLLVAEAVFMYLAEADVRRALSAAGSRFPGSRIAFDTGNQQMIDYQRRHDVMSKMAARMQWACDHPRIVEEWGIGLRLLDSRTFFDVPAHIKRRQPFGMRWLAPVFFRKYIEAYRLNLFEIAATRTASPTAR